MLEMKDGEIVTAASRTDILDYIVNGHSALAVDQANPLNVCYWDDDSKPAMEAPLLIDMQTANVMKMVRERLTPPNQAKFDTIPWAKLSAICWKCVK